MKRVLIVDDSRTIVMCLQLALSDEAGYEPVVAASMAEAKAILEAGGHDFFFAVLDLTLPDAPRGEVVDLVLAYGIPSLVLTSTLDSATRATILSKGVVDYVLKRPEALEEVVTLIRRREQNLKTTVLVVDDSDPIRQITRSYLNFYGFRIVEAADGVEALERLSADPLIRLIVTDYEMPRLNGFELCRKVRATYKKTELAIIGVSSYEDELLSVKFLKGGANDFLAKPFQREELYSRVVQNLENLEYIARIQESLRTIQQMNERMSKGLQAAAALQRSLLPQRFPDLPCLGVASLFRPCDELAGDIFNLFMLDEQHLGMYVLDVSGHGVPAALLSVTLSRLLTPGLEQGAVLKEAIAEEPGYRLLSPPEVCQLLNSQFQMNPETFQYFTLNYGLLNLQTGHFRFSGAGHAGPTLIRKGRTTFTCKAQNMAIGLTRQVTYSERCLDLLPGDRLYFVTDGIVEARNPDKELFGWNRLENLLAETLGLELEQSLQTLYTAVQDWNVNHFDDDVTAIALEFKG